MAKLNKKGFTLIELLAVIAVIAVLVGLAVPTVSGSVNKAAAAADAANLRILSEQAAVLYSNGAEQTEGNLHYIPPYTFQVLDFPTAHTSTCKGAEATVTFDISEFSFTAEYDSHGISYFTEIAETGRLPVSSENSQK